MKNLLFILFLTFNCSAQKAEYNVINDFLASELKNVNYDTIHVQLEPLSNVEMVRIYEQAYKERNSTGKDPESVWLSQEADEWPLDEKEISRLKRKPKNNTKNWEVTDFADKSFVFKNRQILQNINFRIEHFTKGTNEYGLALSKPVFTKNKKYALFTFSFFSLLTGGSSLSNLGTVVMKKENDNWVVLYSIREAVYH